MNGRMQGSTFTSMISWERKSRNATVAHVLTRLPLLNFNLIWLHFEEWNCIHWSVPDTSVFRRFRSHIFNYACALIKPDLLLSTVWCIYIVVLMSFDSIFYSNHNHIELLSYVRKHDGYYHYVFNIGYYYQIKCFY